MAWLSVGVSNEDLCNKMVDLGLLEDGSILEAFRNTDRGDFVLEKDRSDAYLDRPFKKGNIHISAPHMYATVLGGLELEPGLSMLNVGSGSGYLSCLSSYLIGPSGICHGIDINEDVVAHSKICAAKWLQRRINTQLEAKKIDTSNLNYDTAFQTEKRLLLNRSVLEESISFVHGNCFHLNAQNAINFAKYDRIYVGAACPETHKMFFYNLLQINGILILPIIETNKMLKIRRISDYIFTTSILSNVTFAPLINTNDVTPYLEASVKYCNKYHEQVFKELFEEEVEQQESSGSGSSSGRSRSSSRKSPRSPSSAVLMSPASANSSSSASSTAVGKKRKTPSMTQSILTAEPESLILQRTVTEHVNMKALASPQSRKKYLRRSPSAAASTPTTPSTPMAVVLPNRVDLPSIVWQPNKYRNMQFPETFRRAALTLLMCSRYAQRPSAMMSSSSSSSSTSSNGMQQAHFSSTVSVSSFHSSSGHHGYAHYGSLPTQLWYIILSYCNRDWFTPPTSPLQVLSHELLAERQLHLVTRHRLEEAEAARREAERERDLYRAVMLRMSRKQGGSAGCLGSSFLSGPTHLLNHIFGDHPHVEFETDEEHEEDDEEELEEEEEDEEQQEEEGEALLHEESENEEEMEEEDEEEDPMEGEHTEFTDDDLDDGDGDEDNDEHEEQETVPASEAMDELPPQLVEVPLAVVEAAAEAVQPQTGRLIASLSAEEQEDDMLQIAAAIQATVSQSLERVSRMESVLSPLLSETSAASNAPLPASAPSIMSPTAMSATEEEAFVTPPTTPNMLPALLDRYADTIENRGRPAYHGCSSASRSYDTSCATSFESSSTHTGQAGYHVSLSSSLESRSDDPMHNGGGGGGASYSFTSSAMTYLCDPSRYSEASGDEHTVLSSVASVSSSSSSNTRQQQPQPLSHHQYSKNIPIVSPSRQQQHQNILFRPGSGSGRSRASFSGKSGGPDGDAAAADRDSDDDTSSEEEEDGGGEESSLEDEDHFYWY